MRIIRELWTHLILFGLFPFLSAATVILDASGPSLTETAYFPLSHWLSSRPSSVLSRLRDKQNKRERADPQTSEAVGVLGDDHTKTMCYSKFG